MQPDLFVQREEIGNDPQGLNAALDQYFTPGWAAQMLLEEVLGKMGAVGVLEPSCGHGAFLTAIPAHLPAYGVEIDPKAAAIAERNSGRQVLVGDFRTIELPEQEIALIVGNPPFSSVDLVDAFLMRSHAILPEEGVAAFILPAHHFSTTRRVSRWGERFSLDVQTIPRSLFGRISMPLVWAKFTKTDRRTMVGLLLFAEQAALESMPKEIRRRLGRPGSWREAIGYVLQELGGVASLRDIYRAIEPRRPTPNQYWKDKVRQCLAESFVRVDETHWRMPA